jgi:hypothetical protein
MSLKDVKGIEKIFKNGIVYSKVHQDKEKVTYITTICDPSEEDKKLINLFDEFDKLTQVYEN